MRTCEKYDFSWILKGSEKIREMFARLVYGSIKQHVHTVIGVGFAWTCVEAVTDYCVDGRLGVVATVACAFRLYVIFRFRAFRFF